MNNTLGMGQEIFLLWEDFDYMWINVMVQTLSLHLQCWQVVRILCATACC